MARVLLCDDEDSLCRGLARLLRSSYDVATADGTGGIARLDQERFDVVVTDLRMPGANGFDVLDAVRKKSPRTPVIVMSGSAEIHDAVRAMRAGARDFLIKPIEAKQLEEALANVLGVSPADAPPLADPFAWRDRVAPWLLGRDPAMLPVFTTLAQVADTTCTVLITGESGTGKELAARSLVAGSPRARAPFVAVNCAAIPQALVESELFGHVKGSFTGATSTRAGRFAQADGGTIFLDEIGDMDQNAQVKLLRVIQEGEVTPVGGEQAPQKVDVRILAATNRKLESEVAAGRFRADLYWRLNVIPVEMPALRQRASDVALLCEHFIRRANEKNRRNVTGFEPDALKALRRHSWPGNIRELENVIERLVIMRGSGVVTLADLPPTLGTTRETPSATTIPDLPDEGTDLRAILEQVEERMIAEALERTGGNKNRAAELLGLNRTTLVEKLRRKRVAPSA
jgi:DNA-binding NtrC family response regulator